ncbi:MAG: cytochrome c biogenesis protein ResB [Anaerolineae bacterium]|nr:cytochrome c biogenesis protein ResB [Anaerolineae bacterium]
MRKPGIFSRGWHLLSRLNVAAILILIVLLLTVFGSCFPQFSSSFTADAERLASWEEGLRFRYGDATDTLAILGFFHWFRSPIFLFALGLLAVATLICTLDRWRAVWRRAFHQPVRCPDGIFETGPHTAKLKISPAANQQYLIGECLRQRGFRSRYETVGDFIYLRGDRNRLARLATLVTHLAVLLLLGGVILSREYGWQKTLTIAPAETVTVADVSDVTVRNNGFTITRYRNGTVANYEARVTISGATQSAKQGTIRLNQPLVYNGLGFYLRGYNETVNGYSVTLLAVRDPGYGLVIVAGFLLLLGMTVSFNFPHVWINARLGPDGALCLAGGAERRAYDFDHEFALLITALENVTPVGAEENGAH